MKLSLRKINDWLVRIGLLIVVRTPQPIELEICTVAEWKRRTGNDQSEYVLWGLFSGGKNGASK